MESGQHVEKNSEKATKMQRKVERGQAPKGIGRFDTAEKSVPASQDHVHFSDGTSMNVDGSVQDAASGVPRISRKIGNWLEKHGWPSKVSDQ